MKYPDDILRKAVHNKVGEDKIEQQKDYSLAHNLTVQIGAGVRTVRPWGLLVANIAAQRKGTA